MMPCWKQLPTARLQILTLEDTLVTSRGLSALRYARELQGLSLKGVQLSSEAQKVIGGLNLDWLEICVEGDLPVDAANDFRQLTTLVSLKLCGTGISRNAASAIASLKALRHLDLSDTIIDDHDLAHLKASPFLSDVDLSRTRITGPGLSCFLGASNLRVLTLDGLSLDDSAWSIIARFHSVESLSLAESSITDVGLATLAALQNLRSISLVGTRTSDSGLQPLSELSSLLTIRDSQGDIVVVREDWLREDRGSVWKHLSGCAKSDGNRLYRWRNGEREDITDALTDERRQ